MLSSTDDFPELCIRFQTLDKIKPNSLRSYKPQSKKTKIKKKKDLATDNGNRGKSLPKCRQSRVAAVVAEYCTRSLYPVN